MSENRRVQELLRLRTLDVVTKNLAVALGSALSESLSGCQHTPLVAPNDFERTFPPFPRPDMLFSGVGGGGGGDGCCG
jgi:hypothetical protein